MVEWVKVEDRLPETEKNVLCWTKAYYGNGVGIGFFDKKENKWIIADMINDNVVAWADFNRYE